MAHELSTLRSLNAQLTQATVPCHPAHGRVQALTATGRNFGLRKDVVRAPGHRNRTACQLNAEGSMQNASAGMREEGRTSTSHSNCEHGTSGTCSPGRHSPSRQVRRCAKRLTTTRLTTPNCSIQQSAPTELRSLHADKTTRTMQISREHRQSCELYTHADKQPEQCKSAESTDRVANSTRGQTTRTVQFSREPRQRCDLCTRTLRSISTQRCTFRSSKAKCDNT